MVNINISEQISFERPNTKEGEVPRMVNPNRKTMTFGVEVDLLRRDVQDALELQAYQRIIENLISI
jgi:hypothetical protein